MTGDMCKSFRETVPYSSAGFQEYPTEAVGMIPEHGQLTDGFYGTCGLEINDSIHGGFPLNFVKKKNPN